MPISTAQQEALEAVLSTLVDRLTPNAETLLTAMRANGVIKDEMYNALRNRQVYQTNGVLVIACIQHIKIAEMTQDCSAANGSAWKFLIDFLKRNHYSDVANELEARAKAVESTKQEHSSLRVPTCVRPDAAATSSCNISSWNPTPFDCVQQLQKYLVGDYLERFSMLKLFPSSDAFGKLQIDATYVTLRMVRLHQTSDSTVTEMKHIRCEQVVPDLISETSILLQQLLSRGRGYEVPPQPMLIMGDPGQGKTTFAQKLAYDWAMAQKCAASATPFLQEITLLFAFPLRNLTGQCEQIVDFLLSPELFDNGNSEIIDSLKVVKSWILDNPTKVVVLLDGLDEINLRDCTQLNEVLSKSPPTSPDVPLIITTRPYAIPKECPWPLRFEICPLTPTQAREIVGKYFSTRTPENVKRDVTDYCLAEENSFLQSSPLLLHLLCGTVFRTFLAGAASGAPEIQLPRSQTKCYFAIVRWLYERARETRKEKLENFSLETWIKSDIVKKLCELAFDRTFSKSGDRERLVFDRHEVDAKLGELNTQDAMLTGYLVADSLYYGCFEAVSTNFKLSFAHKTFQEFFSAVEIVRKLEKGEDIETLIGDDVKTLRELLLFAIGVGCEKKSRIVGKLLDFVIKLIHRNLSSVVDKYNSVDASFVLSLLKALFRETTDEDQRKALNQFAEQNSTEFERFSVNHLNEHRHLYRWSFVEIAGLFPLGAGFRAFEAVDVSGRHFVFNRHAHTDGESICVLEITAEVAGISKAQVKEIQTNDFYFEGTESGLSSLLSTIGVRSNTADLAILRSPLKFPTHLTTRSLERDALKSAKSSLNVISVLRLSSQLDARDVRNVFEFLSTTRAPFDKEAVKVERLVFWNYEEATEESGDVLRTATNVDDLSACDEPITISVETLHLRGLVSEKMSSRSLSAFAAILNCVREIDCIQIESAWFPLIDEFEKEPSERRLERRVATIQEIAYYVGRSLPSGSLAKFVADVKAKKLEIHLPSSLVISIESFVDFCKILAEKEKSRRVTLQEIEMWILQEVQPLISAIVDSLVGLLRSLRNLKLNLVCRLDKDDIKFVRSLFPAELLDRVSVR